MSIYLGQLGRMVEIKCPASQQVSDGDGTTFNTTLGGRRIAQRPPAPERRTWAAQLSEASTPAQVGTIAAFVNGEWGNGPFVFVSADAPVTNLLTPAAASCAPDEFVGTSITPTEAGPMLTPDGWAGRSFSKATTNGIFLGKDIYPSLPGVPVTVSAYVKGAGGAVRLVWYNIAGAPVGSVASTVAATSGIVRSHATGLPPADAVGFRIAVNNATVQACRAAATWTKTLFDWSGGQGCLSAVVHGSSSDLTLAANTRGAQFAGFSFTVTEVG